MGKADGGTGCNGLENVYACNTPALLCYGIVGRMKYCQCLISCYGWGEGGGLEQADQQGWTSPSQILHHLPLASLEHRCGSCHWRNQTVFIVTQLAEV